MPPSNNCLIQNNYKLEKNNQKWAVLSSKQTGPKLPDTEAAICSLLCNLFFIVQSIRMPLQSWGRVKNCSN